MSIIEDILVLLQNAPPSDILLSGFLFNEGTYPDCEVFVPNLDLIYFNFGSRFLRCETINQNDQLKMSIVDKMKNAPIIEQETDFDLCVCSISPLYFKYYYDEHMVSHLTAYLDAESKVLKSDG